MFNCHDSFSRVSFFANLFKVELKKFALIKKELV